jgi:hypothetical protein
MIMLMSTPLFFLRPSSAQTTTVKIIDATRGTTNINFNHTSPPPTATNFPLGYVLVNVTVIDVANMAAWQINITWNTNLLQIGNKAMNTDMYAPSDNVFGNYADMVEPDFGTNYAFWMIGIKSGGPQSFTGSGTFCQIRFNVTKAPAEGETLTTDIHLVLSSEYPIYTSLVDVDALDILYTPQDGHYEYSYAAAPPPTYDAIINAHCNTENVDVSLSITKDGSPAGFNTPHTFTALTGTHTFALPSTDDAGHPFKQWSTGQTTPTLTVSSGGTFTALYEAPAVEGPDIALTSLSLSRTVATPDHLVSGQVSINMTVANLGNTTETVTVTVFVNRTLDAKGNPVSFIALIATLNSLVLPSGASANVSTVWYTAGYLNGTYIVSANATIVSDDVNPANNMIKGTVIISTIGDVNGDFLVDVTDYQLTKIAIPSMPGKSNWNPNADIDYNGLVEGRDFVILKKSIIKFMRGLTS